MEKILGIDTVPAQPGFRLVNNVGWDRITDSPEKVVAEFNIYSSPVIAWAIVKGQSEQGFQIDTFPLTAEQDGFTLTDEGYWANATDRDLYIVHPDGQVTSFSKTYDTVAIFVSEMMKRVHEADDLSDPPCDPRRVLSCDTLLRPKPSPSQPDCAPEHIPAK